MTPYARSEWDRYAVSGTWTATEPYGLDLDGKPWCPSGFAQRYHAVGACRCAQMTDTDVLRPPETDTDPEPRDHYRGGDTPDAPRRAGPGRRCHVGEWCAKCVEHGRSRVLARDFAGFVEAELASARARFNPINGPHEGYAVILEELDEYWGEVRKRSEDRDWKRQLHELVQVAAMAQRTAEDTGLIR